MLPPTPIIVRPSLLKQIILSLVGGLGMAGGLFFVIGLNIVWYCVATAVAVLMVFTVVAAIIRQRPRVVIGPDGFRVEKVIGEEAHTWDDVAGPFAVIPFGWSKAVGYNFSADYNTRVGKSPTEKFAGYNAVIMGAFQASAEELAEVLNRQLQEYRQSDFARSSTQHNYGKG
jgi:hypothetical protein